MRLTKVHRRFAHFATAWVSKNPQPTWIPLNFGELRSQLDRVYGYDSIRSSRSQFTRNRKCVCGNQFDRFKRCEIGQTSCRIILQIVSREPEAVRGGKIKTCSRSAALAYYIIPYSEVSRGHHAIMTIIPTRLEIFSGSDHTAVTAIPKCIYIHGQMHFQQDYIIGYIEAFQTYT